MTVSRARGPSGSKMFTPEADFSLMPLKTAADDKHGHGSGAPSLTFQKIVKTF